MSRPSRTPGQTTVISPQVSGYVSAIAAESIGIAAMLLGAGRATKESAIDLSVGLVLRKKIGDKIAVTYYRAGKKSSVTLTLGELTDK